MNKTVPILLSFVTIAAIALERQPPRIGAFEAGKHYLENCVVTGRIEQVTIRERIVYLNLEKPHPDSPLTAVIFSSKTNLFGDLEDLEGRSVEISGKITEHQGQLQIVLEETNQLKVLPHRGLPTGRKVKIPAAQAGARIGESLTVTGRVIEVSVREKVVNLNFEQPFPQTPFTAVIFTTKTNLFGNLRGLQGRHVEVSGRIEAHRGKPQIVLNNTNQLKIVAPPNRSL